MFALRTLLFLVFVAIGGLLLIMAASSDGWLSAPFVAAVWTTAYLAENLARRGSKEDWKTYLALPFMLIAFLAFYVIPVGNSPPIPRFSDLQSSTGVLTKGWGGNISLVKEDGSNLALLCADNAGRYMTQTCFNSQTRQAYGKKVTIYHDNAFNAVRKKAFIYEIRYNNLRLINYQAMIDSILYRRRVHKNTNSNFLIMLLTSTICSIVYVWFRWHSQQQACRSSRFPPQP